jgi:hypothetical protein
MFSTKIDFVSTIEDTITSGKNHNNNIIFLNNVYSECTGELFHKCLLGTKIVYRQHFYETWLKPLK